MAVIRAKGQTVLGEIDIEISGDGKVKEIKSSDNSVAYFFRNMIRLSEGKMANGFHPESNTMLQAFAFCSNVFHEDDIEVEGDIGEMECEEGMIY